jgi:exonuclease VII large subunit
MILNASGRPIRSVSELSRGDLLTVTLRDGEIEAETRNVTKGAVRAI